MALRDIANTMHIATHPEKPPHVAPAASISAACSSTTEDLLPVLDISPFLQDPNSDAAQQLAARIADSLKSTGCLVVSAAAGQLIACMARSGTLQLMTHQQGLLQTTLWS